MSTRGRGRAQRSVRPPPSPSPGESPRNQGLGRGRANSPGPAGPNRNVEQSFGQQRPPAQVQQSQFSGGRPAGMSSSESDDDGFDYMSPHSNFAKAPGRPEHGASATYYFTPSTTDPLDGSLTSVTSHGHGAGAGFTDWGNNTNSRETSSSSSSSKVVKSKPRAFPKIPDIDENIEATMSAINKSWNNGFPVNRDSCLAYVTVAVRNLLPNCTNPYSAGIYLLGNCSDFFVVKSGTLAAHVAQELKRWLLERGLTAMENIYLSPSLQEIAFDIVTRQRNSQILKLICEIYRFDKIKERLGEPMRELCTRGHYKDVCLMATWLGMYSEFDIHHFVIPLLLQDKEFTAEEYLEGSKEKQDAILAFLDDLLDEGKNCIQFMRDYVKSRGINAARLEKMQQKPLVKLITRLSNKFKADPLNCPNFGRKKRSAALRHLAFRKYDEREGTLNDACFEELVDATVLHDPVLQDEIMNLMRQRDDLRMAAKFALRHAIPLVRVGCDVQREMHKIDPNVVPNVPEIPRAPDNEDWEMELAAAAVEQKTESSELLPPPPVKNNEEDWEEELNQNVIADEVKLTEPSPQPTEIPDISSPPLTQPVSQIEENENTVQVVPTENFKTDSMEIEDFCGIAKPNYKPIEYHLVNIPTQNIHYMDTPFAIESFLKHLKGAFVAQKLNGGRQDFLIVSIDAEWKPMMFEKAGVALIQVGLGDEVFLLDTFALSKLGATESQPIQYPFFEELRKQFFANQRVVKIGYGLDTDIKMFANTCSQWQNIKEDFKYFLDLQKVQKALVRIREDFFPYSHTEKCGAGLSELVRHAFGKPLSKEEQFSNWENRPLREAQVQYAAADAYILLELFAFMNERSKELNIDLEGIVLNLLHAPMPDASEQGIAKKKKNQNTNTASVVRRVAKTARVLPIDSPYVNVQSAESVKFICDNMVQGLGKQLRSCGIDTYILDNNEDHEKCVDYAFRDGRTILTRGSVFVQLTQRYPELSIYNAAFDKLEDQLQDVLAYFNINICESDLFSRCQKCNCETFISMSRNMMEYVLTNRMKSSRSTPHAGAGATLNSYSIENLVGEITFPVEDGQIVKKWKLLPERVLNISNVKNVETPSGAEVNFDSITPGHLEHIGVFIICDRCGKIYWDGSHLKRVKQGKSGLPTPSSSSNRKSNSSSATASAVNPHAHNSSHDPNLSKSPGAVQHAHFDKPDPQLMFRNFGPGPPIYVNEDTSVPQRRPHTESSRRLSPKRQSSTSPRKSYTR